MGCRTMCVAGCVGIWADQTNVQAGSLGVRVCVCACVSGGGGVT